MSAHLQSRWESIMVGHEGGREHEGEETKENQ